MAVYYNIDQLPTFTNAVLTVGTFDGVHLGHKSILQEVVQHAQAVNGESILITFHPHPRKLLHPNQPLGIITPLEQKLQLIAEAGITHTVIVPFTSAFAQLSAAAYISDFLIKRFQPHTIVIGYDHHFGNDRKGNFALLEQYAPIYNYQLFEIHEQLINDAAVSSTKIRNAIASGQMKAAHTMLGHPYSLKGTVVKGRQLGRTIGYPTANVKPHDTDQIIPCIGVYATKAIIGNHTYEGMMSIGLNPTVTHDAAIKIEINLFDFNADIYGENIEVFPMHYLRAEAKFDGLEALKSQIDQDKLDSIAFFAQQA